MGEEEKKAVSFEEAFAEAVAEDDPAAKKAADDAAAKAAADAAAAAVATPKPGEKDEFAPPEEDAAAKAAAEAKAAEEKVAADAKAAEEKAAADKAAADAAAATPEAQAAAKVEAERVAKEATEKAMADAAAKAVAESKAADEAKAAAEKAAAEDAAKRAAKAPTFDKPFEPTEEEKKVLEGFMKEWSDDIAPGITVLLRKQQHELEQKFSKALYELTTHFTQAVQPIASSVQQSAAEKHYATIRGAHADFEQLMPDVEKWVAAQPEYLKKAMDETLDSGAAKDVIDLFDRYKKEAGIAKTPAVDAAAAAKAAADKAAADAAAAAKATADAAAAAAAATLAPVKSGGTAPKPSAAGVDKNDFAAAWKED